MNHSVSFPEELSTQSFAPNADPKSLTLRCVVVHTGQSMVTGHYYVFRRLRQQWYRCDDTLVEGVRPFPRGALAGGLLKGGPSPLLRSV